MFLLQTVHDVWRTRRKTLLSGLTLCFSMYLIKLLFAYLFGNKKNTTIKKQLNWRIKFLLAVRSSQRSLTLSSWSPSAASGTQASSWCPPSPCLWKHTSEPPSGLNKAFVACREHPSSSCKLEKQKSHLQGNPWRWISGPVGHDGRGYWSWCPPGDSERWAPTLAAPQRCSRWPRCLVRTNTDMVNTQEDLRHQGFKVPWMVKRSRTGMDCRNLLSENTRKCFCSKAGSLARRLIPCSGFNLE